MQNSHADSRVQGLPAPTLTKVKNGREVRYIEPLTGNETEWDMRPAVAVRRLLLPYMSCLGRDGREYLFNRDYTPLWSRMANDTPRRVSPGGFPGWASESRYLYHDGTPERDRVAIGRAVYNEWGIVLPHDLRELVS